MAKKINLTKEQIEAAAKAGREKTEKAYAQKAQAIAKGYGTNSAKSKVGKNRGQLPGVSEVLARNNPAFAALQQAGNAKKLTKGSDAISYGKKSSERKPGQISALGAGDYGASKTTRFDATANAAIYSTAGAFSNLFGLLKEKDAQTKARDAADSARLKAGYDAMLNGEDINTREGGLKKQHEDSQKAFERGYAALAGAGQKNFDTADELAARSNEYQQIAKEGLGKFGQGVVDFGIAGLQFAGDAAMNAILPGSGLAAMGMRAAGSGAQEARNNGLDINDQFTSGLKSAAIEVLTEKLFGAASKVAYGKGIIKNESLVNGLVNRLAKTDKGRTALKVIVGANEEGLEEVLSDILNPVADRVLKLDDGKGDWSDLGEDMDAEQMLEDYIIGSTLGLFGAGTNVISGQYRAENAQQRAYENYQRELVNAGLASEQGSQAQLTAAEYQNILDNSAKRGNRNLSDKETANLEQLITAERDTPAVRNALERSGTLVDDNTASVIAKAASGQKLTRAEQSIIDSSPVMQQAVNTMSRSGAVANIRTTAAKNSVVNSMAERYTVSPEVISRTYDLAPVESPEAFEMAFDAVYQMGQQGANKESLTKVPVLNRAQAEIAYNMGASATQAAVDNAAAQGDNVSTQVNNQINTQEVNNNGVRLRDSGQRLNGQNTEGQIPSVERGTVEAYAGTDSGRQSGYSAAQGKAGQKVVYNGVEQENVYYSGEDNESMKKGRELARSYGYNVQYFEGGNIKDSGGEFRGMVDTESKTVMVRSDHPDISAEQIMRHEMGHAAIAQGDISLDELRGAMLSDLSEKELSSAVKVYRHAYGDTISEAEAFEEMCCDALGKINIFAGTEHDSANYGKVQESFRKHTAETANKGRAPPKKGTMYSREVNGKKIAWIENSPLTAKELRNHKKVAAYIANHIGEAYTIIESGSKVYIGENLPSEYTQSEYTRALLRKNPKTLTAKNKAIGSFGEMIEIATNRRWEKTKHIANKDAKYGVYRYSTAFAFPVKQNNKITNIKSFDAELVILNSSDGKKYLYDIVNIKENTADELDLMKRDQIGGQDAPARRGASENSIRSSSENVNKKFSLEPVKPIQPKNGEWERGSTTDEVRAKHPDLWAVDAESSESRNPTQISGTVKSYRKIYDALKAEGFNGTVLDASSGLGYGTRAGIEEYGFNVEDIEPFPDSSYKPKYTDYSKLHKKYDVIISNAVLNVLPQDQRDALVVKMGQMLNDGGRMFINVRGTDVRNASSKVPIDEANMEYYISNTGSYQKGFTKKELVAYLSDALGKDYTVVGTNKFGAVSAVVTKQAEVSKKFSREVKNAEEYFGTTYKVKEAGYICTDGKMLDFSGRREGAPGGYRTVDHRDITDALGEDYGGEDYSGGMIKFMSEGNIRVSPESGGINLSVAPNKAQRSTLDRYISSFRGEVILDIDRTNGDTIASVEYPKYTHSSVVFKDIDDYFDKGKIPEKFSREPERLNELRRQNERKLAQATAEDAANENERGLIRDYQKQYSKVEDIREKLSTAQQALTEAEDSGADYDTTAKAKNRFTVLSNQYAREHRKLESYAKMKALQNVLTRVDERLGNDLPEGMGAASANFTGEETVGERWVTEAQGKGNNALHPISREQEANLAEQQHRAPQEIPKEDLNGKLTSKHVSTLANSGVTPAEFSDALREDAAQGKFSHIAYSDEAALKKAEITIEANGWEQALADYKAQINAGKVSKDNTVMGIALYNNAVNSGDYATALDIASLMVKNSTNTAQSLQAMRILNKLSPECKLYLAAKSVETIEEDLNERYKDNKADIHVDKVLYDEYGKALRSGDEDGIKTAWAKIEQSVAQQIDATWYEKLNNFRYLAMLGNPRTHVRNIVGNAFFVPVRAVKNTIAYGLENVADSKVNGGIERSKAMLNRNNANDVALIKYAMTDYEAVQETILSGGKYVDTFQGIDKKRTIYKTKILEAARKGNSNLLDAEDAWFCKPAYANALAKWYKANGITAEQLNTGKVPESTIIKAQTVAIKEAQKATYRDTNRFSAMVSRLGKVDNKIASALIEGVLPFKKTPANILVRAVEYSPVGLIKSLAVDTKKVKAYVNGDVENGMSPAQFIDDVSAGLTGTALVGLGVLLASWGLFSGSPGDDDKQNKFDELGGSQNYALNIGGLSITLDWLAPESMPLFVGVELYNSLSGKSEDNGFVQNLMSSVMSLSTPMFEMSMLQSVNDLFDNLAYIKQGQGSFKIVTSMATNYISQYFPTLFGQAERAFGENQRETTYIDRNSNVGSELQYMWGKIANKIPLYDFSQIPYIDAWGRTEETGNLFERVLNNFVNPAYVKKERSTEIDGELKRLYDLGETSVYPSRAKTNTKINGEYLTAEEYVKYATVKGQTSYDLATKIINSSTYSRASDAEKAYMLSYVYKYADQIAKYEVNNEYDKVYNWQMAAYKSSNPAQGIIDHAQEYYKRKENDES